MWALSYISLFTNMSIMLIYFIIYEFSSCLILSRNCKLSMILIIPSVLGYLILSNSGVMIYDEWSLMKLHGEVQEDGEGVTAEQVLEDWHRWFGVTLAIFSAFALAVTRALANQIKYHIDLSVGMFIVWIQEVIVLPAIIMVWFSLNI